MTGTLGVPGLSGERTAGLGGPAPADAATCIITPAITDGPLFVEEDLNRSDIRGSRKGVKTTLTINVFSADANCDPFTGASVDLWHCDAQGDYSDLPEDNAVGQAKVTLGQKFLRGHQVTDGNGQVTFTTIFPGWYAGRTVHIHAKVRVFDGDSTTYEFNTQLYFESPRIAAVMATPAYQRDTDMEVSNAEDAFFDSATVIPLSGSPAKGFTGAIDIGLAGMPEEVEVPDRAVSARVEKVRFSRHKGGRRVAVVTLETGERVSADARLQRGGKLISRKRRGDMARGRRKIRLPIRKGTRAGKAVLRIVLHDRAGNRRVVRRVVRIPPKKWRRSTRNFQSSN